MSYAIVEPYTCVCGCVYGCSIPCVGCTCLRQVAYMGALGLVCVLALPHWAQHCKLGPDLCWDQWRGEYGEEISGSLLSGVHVWTGEVVI